MLLQYYNRMGSPLYYSPNRDTRTPAIWGSTQSGFAPYTGMMANFTEEMQLPVSPQEYKLCTNDSDEEGAMCIVSEERKNDTEEEISVDDEGTESFVCKWNSCDRLFDSPDNLAQHVTVTHATASRSGQYYCCWDGCPRAQRGFNARYKMLVHIRTHTKEKPHKCSVCGKRFSRTENLKIHARSHSGERPYVCPVLGCNKAYSNSSDRFKHTRTHSTDRPYVCKIPGCQKRYTDPSSLRKHVKTFKHHTLVDKDVKPGLPTVENQKNQSHQPPISKTNIEIPKILETSHDFSVVEDKEKDKNCTCTHECFEHIQKATEFFKIGAILNNFASGKTFFNNDVNLAWGKLWNPLITPDFIKNNISDVETENGFKMENTNETMEIDVPLDLTMHK